MLTDEQKNEIARLQSQYNEGLVSASETGILVAQIVFPREHPAECVEAALRTQTWRDYDYSLRPHLDKLFETLLK